MRRVPSAKTQLKPAVGEAIDRCSLPCEMDGIAHVVVQDQGADPDAGCRLGNRCQRHHGRRPRSYVVTHQHDVETKLLGPFGSANGVSLVLAADLKPETKGPRHIATVRRMVRTTRVQWPNTAERSVSCIRLRDNKSPTDCGQSGAGIKRSGTTTLMLSLVYCDSR